MRIILSNLREEDQWRVEKLLWAMNDCASLSIHTRAQLAALTLLPTHELRKEIDEILVEQAAPRHGN